MYGAVLVCHMCQSSQDMMTRGVAIAMVMIALIFGVTVSVAQCTGSTILSICCRSSSCTDAVLSASGNKQALTVLVSPTGLVLYALK